MRFIDFFSGIGGFRLGMEQAGHKAVGHCEIDKYAEMSYRAMHTITLDQMAYLNTIPLNERQIEIMEDNYLNGEWYTADICRIEPRELPDAECYTFGFPCQSFSLAGLRGGLEDTRGTLFFEVLRLAKERQPKILLAENVKPLLSHDGGNTFRAFLRAMDDVGYDAEWQVLNSKHFGVPQNRERMYIVGYLRGSGVEPIFPYYRADSKAIS